MKKIGIIGGIGPAASNKFCELLIKHTPATKDQENIEFIHYCNPKVPDRTEFLLHNGENPLPELIQTAQTLEESGVDFLIMPCNTAHYFLKELQSNTSIPIIDMTKILVKEVLKTHPPIKKIGILATTGSIETGLYQDYFASVGIQTVLPNKEDQEELVMKAIYGKNGIKAGKKVLPKKLLRTAAEKLIATGAEAIVLGCTEIPLVLKQKDFSTKLYDPMELTAKETVRYIKETKKEPLVSVTFELPAFAKSIGREFKEITIEAEVTIE